MTVKANQKPLQCQIESQFQGKRRAGSQSSPSQAEYDLLVIACEPRELIGVCDYSPLEISILNKLVCFTFHTTLLEVKAASVPQEHCVIFAPKPLDQLDGSVYGFRNESAKQFGLEAANKMDRNLVTVYQLWGGSGAAPSSDQFLALLKKQLAAMNWWPYGDDYTIEDMIITPYFNHFSLADLRDGLPWNLLNAQGNKHTFLVHASTCFESVLHCWEYANLMLSTVDEARAALPQDRGAPIAILGAGVSGLLFATRLLRKGYTNVQVLETTQRYGGKTHTIVKNGPYPQGSTEPTVCELATCYLSPAYAPLVEALKAFVLDNSQIDFTEDNPAFRGIMTEGELPPGYNAPEIMTYSNDVILKAAAELGWDNNLYDRICAQGRLALDLAKYSLLHLEYLGCIPPMPAEPPPALQGDFGQQTFLEFLEAHGLLSMVGMLQYGYEVQGYGPLKKIPAYYGLVWITPIITAWTKGWGDGWREIVEKQGLQITYGVQTISIVRATSQARVPVDELA